jgi:hypothetical protein
MSVHIARGADVSPENFEQQCRCALDIAARRFSDHRAKAIFCASWLLSWELYDLLDKDSRVIKFGEQFSRFPHMSPNHSFFMFIFGRDSDDISSLPEKTSLQRKIKEYYMRGGFMHVAGGIYKKDLK